MAKLDTTEVRLDRDTIRWLLGGLAILVLTMASVGWTYTNGIEHRMTVNESHYQELAAGQIRNQTAVMKILNKLAIKHEE